MVAWHASFAVVLALAGWWLFMQGGAEEIVQHRALFQKPIDTPRAVKRRYLLAVVSTVVFFAFFLIWKPLQGAS